MTRCGISSCSSYGWKLPEDTLGLDWCAAAFVQYLYNEGSPKGEAHSFAAGLQDALPHVRKQLPTT